jgi:hypothetical protein
MKNLLREIGIKLSGVPVLVTNIDTRKVTKPNRDISFI